MRITMQQIAERCGLSRPSVSQILGGHAERFAPESVERVLAAARELGYRPNSAARATVTGRFGALGLVYRAQIGHSLEPVIRGVCHAAEACELSTVLAEIALDRFAEGGTAPKLLRELCVDGLVAHYSHEIPEAVLAQVRAARLPLVWTNARQAHDCVHPDDHAALRDATGELLRRGHRRIAYLTHPPGAMNHYSWTDRLAGHGEAMAAAGVPLRLLEVTVAEMAEPEALLRRWLTLLAAADRPQAIIIADQPLAPPLLRAVDRLGLEPGRDLALLSLAMQAEPQGSGWPLPYLLVPMRQVAARAVALLQRRIVEPARPLPGEAVAYDPIRRPELLGGAS